MHAVICPDHFWKQEMCNEVMRTMPHAFHCIPDPFKTQEMCIKALEADSSSSEYVPDWFVTKERIREWFDYTNDDESDHWNYDDDDKFFEWCESYKKRKEQKLKIKEELLPIA